MGRKLTGSEVLTYDEILDRVRSAKTGRCLFFENDSHTYPVVREMLRKGLLALVEEKHYPICELPDGTVQKSFGVVVSLDVI